MKKKLFALACASLMATGMIAQVLFPTPDLYDSGMMNMYINAARETARARLDNFKYFYEMGIDAYNDQRWKDVIRFVNLALKTGYDDDQLYFMRGVAYDKTGYTKEAKKDLRTALKQGYEDAREVLDIIEARERQKK